GHGIVGKILLHKFNGIRYILDNVYGSAERRAVANCEKVNPEGFTKPMEVDEYDWKNGSPEDFYEKYVKTPKPVILRGFAKDTEAAKKWKFDYMVKTYGDEYALLSNKEKDGFPGKLKDVAGPGNYLHNSEVLFLKYPQLMKDLKLDRLEPYIKKGLGYAQFFVGARSGTGTPFHCASNWNWFTMIDGEKTWYFVDPEYSWFIYPLAIVGRAATFAMPLYPDDFGKDCWPLSKWCPYYETTVRSGGKFTV
ncbi:MAG: cupin-like domain-containing protein, partial [Schleiferiaceae bacterium]